MQEIIKRNTGDMSLLQTGLSEKRILKYVLLSFFFFLTGEFTVECSQD